MRAKSTIFSKESEISIAQRIKNIAQITQQLGPEHARNALKSKIEAHAVRVSVFRRRDLGILEALIKYLHEKRRLSLTEISKLLNRDVKTIWSSYSAAQRKGKQDELKQKSDELWIPLSVFRNRDLGVLESLSTHLAKLGLSYKEIATELDRSPKTVYTVLRRAKAKLETKESTEISREFESQEFSDIYDVLRSIYAKSDEPLEVIEQVLKKTLAQSQDTRVPLSIFTARELGILEALSRYLFLQGKKNVEIARLLGRDPRTIWSSIANSKRKLNTLPETRTQEIFVPLSVFADGREGLLRALSQHLTERGMNYREIADALSRNPKTVWTVLHKNSASKNKKGVAHE